MHATAYRNSAVSLLTLYHGEQPFSLWLKNYFREHKKFGSRDRKMVAHLCYCFFRLGKSFGEKPIQDRITIAVFLCSTSPNELLLGLDANLNAAAGQTTAQKLELLGDEAAPLNIFGWDDELSPEIEKAAFHQSFLVQPKLYLRIRPGRKAAVTTALASIPYEPLEEFCIACDNGAPVDQLLRLDEDAVVQDRNSQKVFQLLETQYKPAAVWDCCAASGGKTILFHDLFDYGALTVSDIRPAILHNLKARLHRARIQDYHHFVADVAAPSFRLDKKFDFIICDAPCTGSGTWGRSPEHLVFFTEDKIRHYEALQKSIVSNAIKCLNKNGRFLYITCSVFKMENEEVVRYINEELGLELKASTYFKGYHEQADTLFAALFAL